jgi:serine O-acetyltransferase
MNAIHIYRLAHFLYNKRVPLLPGLLRFLMFLLYNSVIEPACPIGRGSSFIHGGIGVVLHPHCKIGERVAIGQGVTLGGSFGSGPPTVEDDVWIGPGARLLGDITIGHNSIIGANAVVIRDVPPNSVVGGVPAKVIKTLKPGSLDVAQGKLRDV